MTLEVIHNEHGRLWVVDGTDATGFFIRRVGKPVARYWNRDDAVNAITHGYLENRRMNVSDGTAIARSSSSWPRSSPCAGRNVGRRGVEPVPPRPMAKFRERHNAELAEHPGREIMSSSVDVRQEDWPLPAGRPRIMLHTSGAGPET